MLGGFSKRLLDPMNPGKEMIQPIPRIIIPWRLIAFVRLQELFREACVPLSRHRRTREHIIVPFAAVQGNGRCYHRGRSVLVPRMIQGDLQVVAHAEHVGPRLFAVHLLDLVPTNKIVRDVDSGKASAARIPRELNMLPQVPDTERRRSHGLRLRG